MKSSIKFVNELDEDTIRSVHSGDVSRKQLRSDAEEMDFSKSVGDFAHRLIRAHENIDAFIAFYKDGVSHAMSASEAPEVDGNVADITIKYPHGRPVRGLEQLLRDHGEDPEEWDIDSYTANEWPTTMGDDNGGVIYVNNFQAKARMSKKEREPQFEPVQPVEVDTPETPDIEPIDKTRPKGWKTALIITDRQVGHRREQGNWTYDTIHDREAIDLAVQVAGLVKPEILVDVGDLLDFAGISYFSETPDLQQTMQPALCETAYDNARFLSASEADSFHIIEGNHDNRVSKKLIEDAEEMYQLKDVEALKDDGPPAISVPSLLNFDDMGIEWHEGYPDNEVLLNEGVAIEHGETTKSDSGGTVRHLLKFDSTDHSRVFGHIHRHELAWKTIWKGDERREICASSGGCLCKVDGGVPGTKDRQNWQQGLNIVHFDPDGWDHIIEPIRIWPDKRQDGKSVCWYQGKELVANPPTPEELTEKTGFDFT